MWQRVRAEVDMCGSDYHVPSKHSSPQMYMAHGNLLLVPSTRQTPRQYWMQGPSEMTVGATNLVQFWSDLQLGDLM